MHLRHLSIGLAAALLMSAYSPAATVYKWTDSSGVVHFSDQPVPGAERIITQSGPASSSRAYNSSTPAVRGSLKPSDSEQPPSTLDYMEFSIDSPMPEQNFTDSTVGVRLRLEPRLRAGHVITLYMNGKKVENQPKDALEYTLTEVPRGAQALVATVMDTDTGESKSTPTVTFYVQRPSLLSPLRRKK